MAKICPKCDASYPDDATFCEIDQERLIFIKDDLLSEGDVVDDRYRITGVLGKGGMGAVYRAYQLLMDREVALKILKTDAQDASQVKRFFIEAKSASKLTHPNTITVFDFGQTSEGLLYMVIELVRGKTLSAIIKNEGPLPADRCVHIISQICDSISEAHAQGIIHRDLKPDNILIEEKEWNADFVKVLDFGIAKMLHGEEGTSVTKTGIVCGTPLYMSPEAITGKTVSPGADLYSLGIILYEMLSGTPPFQAETPMQLLLKHLSDEPASLVSPSSVVEIPIQLNDFILRVLSKKPELRPATAKEFKEELTQSLAEFKKRPTTTTMSAMRLERGVRAPVEGDTSGQGPARDEGTGAPAPATTTAEAAPPRTTTASVDYDDLDLAGNGKKKGTLIAAMSFALVGLVLLAFVLLGGSKSPAPSGLEGDTGTKAELVDSRPTKPRAGASADASPEGAVADASDAPGAPKTVQGADDPPEAAPKAAPKAEPPIATRLLSTPEGAAVFFSGVEICKTPCALSFDAGKREEKREYRLKLRGYKDATLPIILGMKEEWSARLVKRPKKKARKPRAKAPKTPKARPAPKKPSVNIDIEPGSF
jgi:eukaryotic-like serine/threonine-protein kinase